MSSVTSSFTRRTSSDPWHSRSVIDERDQEIFADRAAAWLDDARPKCGDWIDFADGVSRRISHSWGEMGVQTSKGGSWYLGEGYTSFSGSLYPTVPLETLARTTELRPGSCWIFHHNLSGAGRGVDGEIPFRVWTCSVDAPL